MSTGYRSEDWITLYQSEMAARAVDREAHEHIAALAEAWSAATHDTGHDGPPGCPRPDAPAWPAAVGSAPGADGDEWSELRRRIAELTGLLPPHP